LDSFDGLLDIKSKGAGNSGGLSAAIFGWRVFCNYRRWCMIFNSLEFFTKDLCQPASLAEAGDAWFGEAFTKEGLGQKVCGSSSECGGFEKFNS
jgi:hypothetical protein